MFVFRQPVTDEPKGAERKGHGLREADMTPNIKDLGKEGGTIAGALHTPSSKS